MSQYIQTIALNDVKCFALHGWYPEEQHRGGWFTVDVTTSFFLQGDETENLQQTVNYEVLNTIVLEEMNNVHKLLETVVKNILDTIVVKYPFILSAEVTIKKLNPPMKGEIGNSMVRLTYKAENGI